MLPRLSQEIQQERMRDLQSQLADKPDRLKTLIHKGFSDDLSGEYVKRSKIAYTFLPVDKYGIVSSYISDLSPDTFLTTEDFRKNCLLAFRDISQVCQIKFSENDDTYHLVINGFKKENLNVSWAGVTLLHRYTHHLLIKLSDTEPMNADQLNTLYHEALHAVGLDHPFEHSDHLDERQKKLHHSCATSGMNYNLEEFIFNDKSFLMQADDVAHIPWKWRNIANFPFYSKSIAVRLGVFDVEALQEMYGPNVETRKDDTIYSLDMMSQEIEASDAYITLDTIWDAGGVDTLSAKDVKYPAILNLREGPYQWSFIFNGSETRALFDFAYGANIENAIGGRGINTFYLNSLSNIIDARESTSSTVYSAYPMGLDIIFGFDPERDTLIFEKIPYAYPHDQLHYKKLDAIIGQEQLSAAYGTVVYFDQFNSLLLANVRYQDVMKALDKNIVFEYVPPSSALQYMLLTLYDCMTPQLQQSFLKSYGQAMLLNNFLHFSQKQLLKQGVTPENVKWFSTLFQCGIAMLTIDFKFGLAISMGIILCQRYLPQTENILSVSAAVGLTQPEKGLSSTFTAIGGSIAAGIVSKCTRLLCFGRKKQAKVSVVEAEPLESAPSATL